MNKISKKGSVNYSEGKIYIIKNTENSKVYIGSTCWEIARRFNEHKRGMNKTNMQNYMLYTAMSTLGTDCFYWELIELFPCDNISQLRAREGHWIKHYDAHKKGNGYNKKVETRSRHEYYEDNKEYIALKSKEHHESHKEERHDFYNAVMKCRCGFSYTRANKSRHERTKQHQQALLQLNQQET
jgi:hypothetical protein